MNKWRRLLFGGYGIFVLWIAFWFVFSVGQNSQDNSNSMPYFVASAAIVFFGGIGMNLGYHFLTHRFVAKRKADIALCFSLALMIFQGYWLLVPGMTRCKCSTFAEYLMEIKDWRDIKTLLLFLGVSCIVFWYRRTMSGCKDCR